MRRLAIVALLIVLGMPQGVSALESSGEELLQKCNAECRERPDSVEAHFNRARALQQLGRSEEAVRELRLCSLLSPTEGMRKKIQAELDFLTLKPPEAPPSTITQQDLERTATRVTNQAADRIRLIQAQSMLSMNGWARPPRFQDWRSMRFSRRTKFDRRTESLGEYSRQRCRALAECAEALKANMTTKPSPNDTVYLSPHGTNLYVRNYITLDPVKPEPIQPLLATALSYKQKDKDKHAQQHADAKSP